MKTITITGRKMDVTAIQSMRSDYEVERWNFILPSSYDGVSLPLAGWGLGYQRADAQGDIDERVAVTPDGEAGILTVAYAPKDGITGKAGNLTIWLQCVDSEGRVVYQTLPAVLTVARKPVPTSTPDDQTFLDRAVAAALDAGEAREAAAQSASQAEGFKVQAAGSATAAHESEEAAKGYKEGAALIKGAIDSLVASASFQAVVGVADDIPAVADVAEHIPAVAGAAGSIPTVAGVADELALLAPVADQIAALALIAADIQGVNGVKADVTSVAEKLVEVQAVYAKLQAIEGVYGKSTEIDALYAQLDTIAAKANQADLDAVEDRLDTLEGTGAGSVAKAIDDAVSPLAEKVYTNRLYSDSQYLELKAQADAQALEIQASRAELYNGYKILQFGSTDIIGKGTKADYSAIDVSANVVDGKLSMEQKGLTITNLVDGASIANLGTVTFTTVLNGKYYDTSNNAIITGTGSDMTATNNSGATANMAIYHLNALGLSTITDTAILAKLLPYVDGTANVGKMGIQILDADDAVTQTIFLPAIGNSLPNGVADSVKTTVDGWEHTKRVSDELLLSSDMPFLFDAYRGTTSGGVPLPNFYILKANFPNFGAVGNGPIGGVGFNKILYNYTNDLRQYVEGRPLAYIPASGNLNILIDLAYMGTDYATFNALSNTGKANFFKTWLDTQGISMLYQLATPITTHYNLPLPTSGKTIHRFAGEEKIALYGTGVTFSENVLSVLSAVKFVAGVMTDITSLATITTNTVTFSGVNATDVVYVKVEHSVNRPLGILEHTPAVSNTASRLLSLEARVTALEA